MNRGHARRLLARLHAAQGEFYTGASASGDVQWHVPSRNAITRTCRGRDQGKAAAEASS